MKDMKSIIVRIILVFIAFIVIITIYGLKGNTGEDKRKIKQDQERMVQFVLEKIQLKNDEEIEKIKFINGRAKLTPARAVEPTNLLINTPSIIV